MTASRLPDPLDRGRSGWPWQTCIPGKAPAGPLFSVVVPSLNQGNYIEHTIRSVLCQDRVAVELIVIDGGSTDGTLEVLEHYRDHLQWVSEPDDGQADAINKGLAQTSGSILAYLNSDDFYLAGALGKVAEAHASHPEAGLLVGDTVAVFEDGGFKGRILGGEVALEEMIKWARFLPQQSTFWTREAMSTVGVLDPGLHLAMDHDWFIRLRRASPIHHIACDLAAFRFHASCKSVTSEDRHWREVLRVCRRHGLRWWHAEQWVRVVRRALFRALPPVARQVVRRRLGRGQDPLT